MKKPNLPFLLLFFSLLTIVSCDDYPCNQAYLYYGFVGFSDTEADTIILRRYEKSNNGSVQYKDSLFLDKTSIGLNRRNDTLFVAYSIADAQALTPNFDYQFYFPAITESVSVSDIEEEQLSNKPGALTCNKPACVNSITSYRIDGQRVQNNGFPIVFLSR